MYVSTAAACSLVGIVSNSTRRQIGKIVSWICAGVLVIRYGMCVRINGPISTQRLSRGPAARGDAERLSATQIGQSPFTLLSLPCVHPLRRPPFRSRAGRNRFEIWGRMRVESWLILCTAVARRKSHRPAQSMRQRLPTLRRFDTARGQNEMMITELIIPINQSKKNE